jgi:spore coat protein U-like protein
MSAERDIVNRTRLSVALTLALTGIVMAAAPAQAACSISTTSVGFGVYDVFAYSPLDSTGTVSYTCAAGSAITIILDKGGAQSFDPRQMVNGSQRLNYNLYLDAQRATIWGDGTGNTQLYTNASTPSIPVVVTIYGRIPALQDVSAGTYTSTVTAIVNF